MLSCFLLGGGGGGRGSVLLCEVKISDIHVFKSQKSLHIRNDPQTAQSILLVKCQVSTLTLHITRITG